MERKRSHVFVALLLAVLMVFGGVPGAVLSAISGTAAQEAVSWAPWASWAEPVFGASPTQVEKAISDTLSGYYDASQEKVLDDWEELLAVYATGEDLSGYALPVGGSGAAAVLTALVKGDGSGATAAANGLVSGGALVSAQYAYGDALAIIALEAHNRSDTLEDVVYNKAAAVALLLGYKEGDGGFGYGDGGDPDTTGLVLTALSLFAGDSGASYYAAVDEAIDGALSFLHRTQQSNGGFSGAWSGNNANSAAVVLWGLLALGEDPQSAAWTTASGKNPVDALLSFHVSGSGFGVTDAGADNQYATKDALLALADVKAGRSVFTTLSQNSTHYISVAAQVAPATGSFVEKALTLEADGVGNSPLATALDAALGTTGSNPADYNVFVNGDDSVTATTTLQEGDSFLAVAAGFEKIAYFKAEDSDALGINRAEVEFGGSATLTLVEESLAAPGTTTPSALASIPVDYDGDGQADGTTDGNGVVSLTPLTAGTHTVKALATGYDWNYKPVTYLPATTALVPAKLTMKSGTIQTCRVGVRVEGPFGNLLYLPDFLVGNSGHSRLTVYDAVKQALDSKKVDYVAGGGYFSSIGGYAGGTLGGGSAGAGGGMGWDGWLYNIIKTQYLDGSAYVAGMATQLISAGDEILVYYGNDDYTTLYATVDSELVTGGDVALTVKAYQGYPAALSGVGGVEISWGVGTACEYTTTTAIDGTALIPAAKASVGSHSLQISKTGAYGLPSVVPLPPGYAITVSDGSSSGGSSVVNETDSVYLRVTGPNSDFLKKTAYDYYSGITPLDLLRLSGLPYVYSGRPPYVSEISGVAEFDRGTGSGWLYKVNGNENILDSASAYELSPEDYVVWFYTADYTKEKGSSSWSGVEPVLPGAELSPVTGPATASVADMADVAETAWYYEAVAFVMEKGLFQGLSESSFGPEAVMDRAMWATVLHRLAGLAVEAAGEDGGSDEAAAAGGADAADSGVAAAGADGGVTDEASDGVAAAGARDAAADGAFADVPADAYYAEAVRWASETGIINGTGAGFEPEAPVTREQLVTMLYRYGVGAGLITEDHGAKATDKGLTAFKDGHLISPYAVEAMEWAVAAGLLTGRPNGTIDPAGQATRAEVAAILQRFL